MFLSLLLPVGTYVRRQLTPPPAFSRRKPTDEEDQPQAGNIKEVPVNHSNLPRRNAGEHQRSSTTSDSPMSEPSETLDPERAAAVAANPENKQRVGLFVTWSGPDDPGNPQNYSIPCKIFITSIWVYGNLVVAIGSSIWSSCASAIRAEFHASNIVVTLGVSLFLIGYALAPPIWGPLSERFGRKWPMTLGMFLFTIFCIPAAVGTNLETLLIARFFQGAFGSAALALVGGGIVDIWSPAHRGVAVAACIGTIFGSPILAPIIGNFVEESYLGWRWTQWISCIMGGCGFLLCLFCLPETLAPMILHARAVELRKSGEDPAATAAFDNTKQARLADIVRIYLVRPFTLLTTEPILLLVTIYQSFIYGMLYLVFVSYPIEFREIRGWAPGISALPFLGLMVGVLIGAAFVVWHTKTRFTAAVEASGGKIVPEQRLPLMIMGGCLLPVGLFIFAWTSHPTIHWAGMVVGSIPTGMGMYMVFVQCFNYLIDVYAPIANSAIGGNTFIRSFFGAGFPLFGPYMYHNLGVNWATSTLGFISIAMIPIPILFYKYGYRIRSWSTNSISAV